MNTLGTSPFSFTCSSDNSNGKDLFPSSYFQQFVLSEMKSICCVQESVLPKIFPALCFPP